MFCKVICDNAKVADSQQIPIPQSTDYIQCTLVIRDKVQLVVAGGDTVEDFAPIKKGMRAPSKPDKKTTSDTRRA
jgi:hypothetical protein